MMEVYRTENKVNGKFYYGVTNGNNPYYLGSGVLLKKAISKYGTENFIRRSIAEFDTTKEAYDFERLIVDKYLVENDNCYNVQLGGSAEDNYSERKGFNRKHTDASKKKMSESSKGYKWTDSQRANFIKARTGLKYKV